MHTVTDYSADALAQTQAPGPESREPGKQLQSQMARMSWTWFQGAEALPPQTSQKNAQIQSPH